MAFTPPMNEGELRMSIMWNVCYKSYGMELAFLEAFYQPLQFHEHCHAQGTTKNWMDYNFLINMFKVL